MRLCARYRCVSTRRVLVLAPFASLVGCAAPRAALTPAAAAWNGAGAVEALAPRRAEEGPALYAARGFFVGAMGVATTLSDSDFDGQSGLIDPVSGTAIVLPELDPGIGWGVTVGYRGKRNSVQFTYAESTHDDDFLGTSLEDEFRNYSLDFKHHWNVGGALQPYLLLGIAVPRVIITDGASLGGATGDAALQGLGANLGGGAALYVTPHLALFGEAFYRWAEFDRAAALGIHRDIHGHLDASGIGLRGGLTFTF